MRLTELDPRWTACGGDGIFARTGELCPHCMPGALNQACPCCFGHGFAYVPAPHREHIGLTFLCPCGICLAQRTGFFDHDFYLRHFIPFTNPPDGGPCFTTDGKGPTWQRTGETFDTLQLSPSILSDPAKGGCGWHGYIGNPTPGEVTTC